MKVYRIKVNGKVYEVEVELVENKDGNLTETPNKESYVPNVIERDKSEGNGENVKAPMQGSILSIKVSKGDRVLKGDTLLVLEAMKMENEIVAPSDGTVASINVAVGDSVEAGATLATLN